MEDGCADHWPRISSILSGICRNRVISGQLGDYGLQKFGMILLKYLGARHCLLWRELCVSLEVLLLSQTVIVGVCNLVFLLEEHFESGCGHDEKKWFSRVSLKVVVLDNLVLVTRINSPADWCVLSV